ncbi:MAG: hypothetical protein ACREJU_13435 [Nitrospiraceae bacterium]
MSAVATSPTFMCNLNSRQEVAEGTMAFRFEKPAGWAFKAGQFIGTICENLDKVTLSKRDDTVCYCCRA